MSRDERWEGKCQLTRVDRTTLGVIKVEVKDRAGPIAQLASARGRNGWLADRLLLARAAAAVDVFHAASGSFVPL